MTLNKAFLCLLFVLSTLFPVNFALAGTTSYTDLATFVANVPFAAPVSTVTFSGTPGDVVPSGTAFSGFNLIQVYGENMVYGSAGEICITGSSTNYPRIDLYLDADSTAIGLNIDTTVPVEVGMFYTASSSYQGYDLISSTGFLGLIGGDATDTLSILAYNASDTFCISVVSLVLDVDGDGLSGDLDCDEVDNDLDGSSACDDCDDTNLASYLGAAEIEDGLDNDCDGIIDEGTNAYDDDDDGYNENAGDCNDAEASISPAAAEVPYNGVDEDCNSATPDDDLDGDSYVLASDCDDTNSGMNPGEVEVAYDGIDNDCSATTSDDDIDGDGYNLADDCDDTNSGINPGASEVAYDGIDQDCSGADLDDVDGDGSAYPDDCNDSNSRVYPGAMETCNGRDENCDGLIDEGYTDSDGDGNADCVDEDLDGDTYTPADGDCDDTNTAINPGATDIPDNGIDEDCSGEDLTDADSDGYGTAEGDCDDSDPTRNPGATEICDGIDQDCDGSVDDNASDATVWYADSDSDTFGDSGSTTIACTQPPGYVGNDSDCNDADSSIHPGAEDVPDDGIDQDCDGSDATTPVDTGDTGDSGVIDTGDSGTDTAVDDTAGGDTAGTKIKIATGCGCDSGPGFGPGLAWLVGLALLIRRRS